MATTSQLQLIITARDDASRKLSAVSKELNRVSSTASDFGKKFSFELGLLQKGLKYTLMGVTALGAGIVALGLYSLNNAKKFEQYRLAFETMLGSSDKAKKLMEEIVETAKKTPFELDELVTSTKQMLAMGVEESKLIKTTTMLGDVSAGLGVELNRIAYNYGQVKAQGKLTGVEMKDFMRMGIPMIEELAKTLGKSESAIKDMVSAGEIGFDDVEKAFEGMTGEGGKFHDLMIRQSSTLGGLISNLKDSFTILGMEIVGVSETGEIIKGGLFDKIKEGASLAYTWVDKNSQAIKEFATKYIQMAIDKVIEWYNQMGGAEGLKGKLEDIWMTIKEDIIPAINKFVGAIITLTGFIADHWKGLLLVIGALELLKIGLAIVPLINAVTGAVGLLNLAFFAPAIGLLAVLAAAFIAIILIDKKFKELKKTQDEVLESTKKNSESLDEYQKKVGSLSTVKANEQLQNSIDKARDLNKEAEKLGELGFFGSVWSGVKGLFGRDLGGSVNAGQPYIVGEHRPEMFVPSQSGNIKQLDQASKEITVNFNNVNVRSDGDLQSIIEAVKKTLNSEQELYRIGAI